MRSYLLRNNALCLASPFTSLHFARNKKPQLLQLRSLHDDGRRRLSRFWVPTGGIAPSNGDEEDSHSMLVRGGFVRQAHSGLFQFLPLGLRIQEKLESLLDKHMVNLGASKISLSTFSSEALWEESGRLHRSSELFRFSDRKDHKYLLSPTHEEEITSLVGGMVKSYKDLPLMLYQITRKYRDELRPRQGLLRTREFLMKDLYTFDSTKEKALDTYENVRRAYTGFFDEFKIPYVVAEADSGDIGGDLSHEYHFPTPKGEDRIISCTSCSFAINEEEVAKGNLDLRPRIASSKAGADSELAPTPSGQAYSSDGFCSWYAISKDHHYLVEAVYPAKTGPSRTAVIDPFLLKKLFPELDLGVENPMDTFIRFWKDTQAGGGNGIPTVHRIFDFRVPESQFSNSTQATTNLFSTLNLTPPIHINPSIPSASAPDLLRLETGDPCPKCFTGTLRVQTAVELGHTFFLGTRYSKPLRVTITSDPSSQLENSPAPVPMQMGCHGIGVSRLIAAVADTLADPIGLNWPRVMAPFEVVIIPYLEHTASAMQIYDSISSDNTDGSGGASPALHIKNNIDAVLDDRDRSFVWKLKDAELIGYPVVVLLGKRWKVSGKAEVRCRRLGVDVEPEVGEVKGLVERLLGRL